MMNLSGKHAVVTGASRGIGLAVAKALLRQGARVTITARQWANLKNALTELHDQGDVHAVELDVTDSAAVPAAFAAAATHFGSIAILVNNAGQAQSATFMQTDLTNWHAMLSVNLTSVVMCTQAALPAMITTGWGRVVNVASTAGLSGYGYASAYCAAKHAVMGLTRSLALEVAKQGVTVNAVCPGYTDTELVQQAVTQIVNKTGRSKEQALASLIAHNPQGKLVQAEQVANAVAWLCRTDSAAVNGQAIVVDGGELA